MGTRAIHNLGQIFEDWRTFNTLIIPNGDTILALNSPDPYNSNGATYMCIRAQYKEIWKLPEFCLHVWRKLDHWDMLRIIYS